jgi:GrpB-like predicted nucleotidyltransferase (UPF0157 family)
LFWSSKPVTAQQSVAGPKFTLKLALGVYFSVVGDFTHPIRQLKAFDEIKGLRTSPVSTVSLGLPKGTSSVASYSDQWPQRFLEEKRRILSAFAQIRCEIYHIGSTSITGLPAKPVIDIALALESDFEMSEVISTFKSLGYKHHDPKDTNENHWFEYGHPLTYYQAYTFAHNSSELSRHLIFCKELATNMKTRMAYAEIKQEASKRFGKDPKQYVEFKRGFIDEVIASSQ